MPVPRSSFPALFAGFGALVALVPACASTTPPAERLEPVTVAEENQATKRERTVSSTESNAPRRAKTAQATNDKGDEQRERGFPADELKTAMHAASDGLTSCADSTPRTFQAALRIETSGQVSRVTVTPPDGAAAACVEKRLLELSVSPFSGDSVTIMMPVKLPAR